MMTLAERLRKGLDRLPGATPSDLARACRVRQPSVSDWLSGRTKTLKAESYRLAAAYLHCRREWLETGYGDPGWTDSQHTDAGGTTVLVAQDLIQLSPHTSPITTNRTPVLGELQMGEEGRWELRSSESGEAIGYVDTVLASATAFAVQIVGDDLYPAVRHGACLVVEPDGALTPGELVLVRMRAGHYLVCELVANRPDSVLVTPAQGGARRTLLRSDVLAAHPVTSVVAGSKFRSR